MIEVEPTQLPEDYYFQHLHQEGAESEESGQMFQVRQVLVPGGSSVHLYHLHQGAEHPPGSDSIPVDQSHSRKPPSLRVQGAGLESPLGPRQEALQPKRLHAAIVLSQLRSRSVRYPAFRRGLISFSGSRNSLPDFIFLR